MNEWCLDHGSGYENLAAFNDNQSWHDENSRVLMYWYQINITLDNDFSLLLCKSRADRI